MNYIREFKSLNPIAIDGFGSVDTGVSFKQYDANTSILVMDITYKGEPLVFGNEDIFISLKSGSKLVTNKFAKVQELKGVILKGEKVQDGVIKFTLSPLALELVGLLEGEVLIVDVGRQKRITSQKFTLTLEPSLTPNQKSAPYVPIKDFDGNFITDIENFEIIAPTLEANATAIKLNFTGERVNEILQKADTTIPSNGIVKANFVQNETDTRNAVTLDRNYSELYGVNYSAMSTTDTTVALFPGSLRPASANHDTIDLGQPGTRWRSVYCKEAFLDIINPTSNGGIINLRSKVDGDGNWHGVYVAGDHVFAPSISNAMSLGWSDKKWKNFYTEQGDANSFQIKNDLYANRIRSIGGSGATKNLQLALEGNAYVNDETNLRGLIIDHKDGRIRPHGHCNFIYNLGMKNHSFNEMWTQRIRCEGGAERDFLILESASLEGVEAKMVLHSKENALRPSNTSPNTTIGTLVKPWKFGYFETMNTGYITSRHNWNCGIDLGNDQVHVKMNDTPNGKLICRPGVIEPLVNNGLSLGTDNKKFDGGFFSKLEIGEKLVSPEETSIQLPGGIIMKTGISKNHTSSEPVINFKKAFPNAILSVQITCHTAGADGNATYNNESVNGFQAHMKNINGTIQSFWFSWTAIGF